uniref:Prion-like-(Q/N-rich) domain-bearing protein 25 isoform X2 n=1 Tax=Crassostrea virginica TaxID=6565 RepID=A0A8B8AZH0_CRAVI|nr:prion-like-(Q/N-rich) domain-bearing protein 25 isoform X2 [Crassostrea virginica]
MIEHEAMVHAIKCRRTCQTKCNVAIHKPNDHMYLDTFYSLRRTTVYFGEKPASENKCANLSDQIDSQMFVYCSSRQDDGYLILDGPYCQMYKAYCTRIGNICFCQCHSGYILVNSSCLMNANVRVGYSCFSSQQCNGTDFSGVCKNDVCHCQQEYLQLHETCYRANVHVGDTCSFQQQCSGTDHSGVCSYGFCQCQQGYLQKDRTCYRANVHVGDACSFQQQCSGTDHSGVCSYGFCQCQQGYLQKDRTCYRAVPLNWSCVHHLQCLGSPYAACLNGKCHCIAGYIAENSSHCVLGRFYSFWFFFLFLFV